jgi:crossover junction endodeoxyribonuclease RuvC
MSDKSTTRILGLDTALRTTGYGIVDTDGRTFAVVDCGIIRTSPKERLAECLRRLGGGIRELAESYAPDVVAIEGTFFFKNARTAMVLGMARGAAISALTERGIPIYEYAPRRVKQAVCGYGNAGKEQVALLVAQILGVPLGEVKDDASDALALAICHAHTALSANGLFLPPRM